MAISIALLKRLQQYLVGVASGRSDAKGLPLEAHDPVLEGPVEGVWSVMAPYICNGWLLCDRSSVTAVLARELIATVRK